MVRIEVNTKQKEWWKSKTLWANILIIIASIISSIAGYIDSASTISLVALLNIVLRVITKTELVVK